ncbi:MAG: hypothetical protein LUH18_04250 [Oscillospiraceae bacterium]|nr:hypothetical protein [Oscillospiraceae bacterium]
MKTIKNYEIPKMDVVLFDGEVWNDVLASKDDSSIHPAGSREAAIAQAEEEYKAYQ